MSGEHTPVPWKGDMNVDEDQFSIYPDTGKMAFPIATFPSFSKPEVNAANAAFIVRAVNSHDALVKALIEAAEFIQPFNRAEDLLERIDAALSLTKDGQL